MTAARTSSARSSPAPARPSARPAPSRPWLTVVPQLPVVAPRAPFVSLVTLLLTAGLGALLFLHTSLAENSFRLHDLRKQSVALVDREQALAQEVAAAASPARLALRARALGMVRSENPVFIRTSDSRILGVPKAGVLPAPKPQPKPAQTSPSGAPTPGASPAPSASAAPSAAASPKPSASPR